MERLYGAKHQPAGTDIVMSSPQQCRNHKAFRMHMPTLVTAITDPRHLATQLYAENLIDKRAHQRADLALLSLQDRSHDLLVALEPRIATDEKAFDTFLTILSTNPVMEEMCEKLRESRDASATSHLVQVLPPTPRERYMFYLKEMYKNDPPSYEKWPNVRIKKIINLCLLSRNDVLRQEAHKYTKAMFNGAISTIASGKKIIMADIAKTKDGSIIKGRRRCILVEGAPGVGKSTFVWKLCRKWCKGKILEQYSLVVLLRLREKRVREAQKASDLFQRCDPAAIAEICQSGGDRVLLVMDGWDELPNELRETGSLFLDLIQGHELPDATVVVTSRPHASEVIVTQCQDHIFQHIEVMGFSEDDVMAYIKSSAGDDTNLLQGLEMYTSCYPHIRSMMSNPMNAAIVVEVYKNNWKEGSTIPKTTTELYSSLIRTLLLRYLKEHPDHCMRKKTKRLCDFNDLPPDVYQLLCKVSRVAYEGISNKQQVIFSDLSVDFDSLDLMRCVPELYVDEGVVMSYNFLHLTVQEFLAAFYLSQQSTQRQIEIFRLHQNDTTYRMVLKFLAGLTNFKGFSTDTLLSILTYENEFRSGVKLTLDGLHFLFEGKGSIKMLNGLPEVDISVYRPSPFDCYVLGYIVSHTSCKWAIHVEFVLHDVIGEMFTKGTMEDGALCPSTDNTVYLNFHGSRLLTSGLQQLLTAHPSLLARTTHIHLPDNRLDSRACDLLSQSLPSLPHLQSLDISLNAIGSTTMSSLPEPSVQLIKTLGSHNTLKSLGLKYTKIGLAVHAALAPWLLSPTCSLEVLEIGKNIVKDPGWIITHFCQNSTLRELDISDLKIESRSLIFMFRPPLIKLDLSKCNINPEKACKFTIMLYSNTVLEELYLSDNPVGDKGATALAVMLRNKKRLKILNMCNTSLTSQGTKALLHSLKCSATLSNINFSSNLIGEEGALALADMLLLNKTLKIINWSRTSLTPQGAQALQQSLQHNATLCEIDLSYNPIEDRGAIDLADMLRHNNGLKIVRLYRTCLTAQGTQALLQSLQQNDTLIEIELSKIESLQANTDRPSINCKVSWIF